MSTLTLLFLFLGSVQLVTCAPTSTQVRLTSQVYVCEGDTIDLIMTDEDPKSAISSSKIFKNGGGNENIMIKEGDKKPVFAPRLLNRTEYINRLGVKIHHATVNDSGPYEMHFLYKENEGWHRWHVSVFTGCPKKADYVSPSITYKLDQGPLEPLPDTKTIQFAAPKMLTLKVGIPMANLPVTCWMWGHGDTRSTTEGSGDKTVYCQATFHYDQPENGTLHVELSHKIRSRVKTEIRVYATTAGRPSTDALGEGKLPSPLLWLLLLLLLPALIVLVAGIIVCKRKEIGPFKKGTVITFNTESPAVARKAENDTTGSKLHGSCQDETTYKLIGESGKDITLHQNDNNDKAEHKNGLI